jgi:hypothetical protein
VTYLEKTVLCLLPDFSEREVLSRACEKKRETAIRSHRSVHPFKRDYGDKDVIVIPPVENSLVRTT